MRRSKIEVHPEFSEASHLKSSIQVPHPMLAPHPKTDFNENQIAIPMNDLMAQVYKNVILRNDIAIRRRFWVFKEPRIRRKKVLAEMCYLYRGTRHIQQHTYGVVEGFVWTYIWLFIEASVLGW